jgi:hypothetical protein
VLPLEVDTFVCCAHVEACTDWSRENALIELVHVLLSGDAVVLLGILLVRCAKITHRSNGSIGFLILYLIESRAGPPLTLVNF